MIEAQRLHTGKPLSNSDLFRLLYSQIPKEKIGPQFNKFCAKYSYLKVPEFGEIYGINMKEHNLKLIEDFPYLKDKDYYVITKNKENEYIVSNQTDNVYRVTKETLEPLNMDFNTYVEKSFAEVLN